MTRRLGGVEFLGRVSDDEKAQLFKTADVYVSPATGGESFGIVLLEAMAAGTPIVCSDIHGYKGVVRRGREALLVPPREPKALAAALARLLDDADLRAPDERDGHGARPGVQLGARDRQGRRLLRLRDPPARGAGPAAAGLHAEVPPSARSSTALGERLETVRAPAGARLASAATPSRAGGLASAAAGSARARGRVAAPRESRAADRRAGRGPRCLAGTPAGSALGGRFARGDGPIAPDPRCVADDDAGRRASAMREQRSAPARAGGSPARPGRVFTGNWNG